VLVPTSVTVTFASGSFVVSAVMTPAIFPVIAAEASKFTPTAIYPATNKKSVTLVKPVKLASFRNSPLKVFKILFFFNLITPYLF